jgi:hypothetical protein
VSSVVRTAGPFVPYNGATIPRFDCLFDALEAPALVPLLELDQIRAAQGRSLGLERLVLQIGAELIEDIVEADRRLVVGGGEARVDRDHVGEVAQRRSHRGVGDGAADLPAGQDQRGDALGFERVLEICLEEPILGERNDLDVVRGRRDLRQPVRHGGSARRISDHHAGLARAFQERRDRWPRGYGGLASTIRSCRPTMRGGIPSRLSASAAA